MELLLSCAPHCVDADVFLSAKIKQLMERQRVSGKQRLIWRHGEVILSAVSSVSSFGDRGIVISKVCSTKSLRECHAWPQGVMQISDNIRMKTRGEQGW